MNTLTGYLVKFLVILFLPFLHLRIWYMQQTGQITPHDLVHIGKNQDDPEVKKKVLRAIFPMFSWDKFDEMKEDK